MYFSLALILYVCSFFFFFLFLDYHHQKDRKYNSIDVKRVSNESIPVDEPYPSPVTLTPSKDASQTEIRKHRTYAKEEDIKTIMDTLPTESDNVNNLPLTMTYDGFFCDIRICKLHFFFCFAGQ